MCQHDAGGLVGEFDSMSVTKFPILFDSAQQQAGEAFSVLFGELDSKPVAPPRSDDGGLSFVGVAADNRSPA